MKFDPYPDEIGCIWVKRRAYEMRQMKALNTPYNDDGVDNEQRVDLSRKSSEPDTT